MTENIVGPYRWALLSSDLGKHERSVAHALATRMDGDGTMPDRFRVGVRRLAADTALHVETVQKALANLHDAGWLEVAEPAAGRRAPLYRLSFPESLRPAPPDTTESLRAVPPDTNPEFASGSDALAYGFRNLASGFSAVASGPTGHLPHTSNNPHPPQGKSGAADAAPGEGMDSSSKIEELARRPDTGAFWAKFVLNIPNSKVRKRLASELRDPTAVAMLDQVFYDTQFWVGAGSGGVPRDQIWDKPTPLDDPGIKSILKTLAHRFRTVASCPDLGKGAKATDPDYLDYWRTRGRDRRAAA